MHYGYGCNTVIPRILKSDSDLEIGDFGSSEGVCHGSAGLEESYINMIYLVCSSQGALCLGTKRIWELGSQLCWWRPGYITLSIHDEYVGGAFIASVWPVTTLHCNLEGVLWGPTGIPCPSTATIITTTTLGISASRLFYCGS